MINSPHFEDLFVRIRNIFAAILGAKGGACFIATNPQEVKLILNVLEYHQQDLKRMEASLPEDQRVYHEDNILGIFDYGSEFDMSILNGIKENIDEKRFSKRLVRIGIFARQISTSLKYIVHATNCLDKICVRKMADDYDERLLQNLSQIAHIATKNRISNQALRSLMHNDFVVQLLTSVMTAKTFDDVYFKNAEIALISEILYSGNKFIIKFDNLVFLNDNGKLPLLWADTLYKIIPPISKIIKDEKNNEFFAEAKELKVLEKLFTKITL